MSFPYLRFINWSEAMALTDRQMQHPKFLARSGIANDVLRRSGPAKNLRRQANWLTETMRRQADRLVVTALLIRADRGR
ncbi:hypothetical protein ACHMW7_08940 [Aminobacter sp. UC22_36]|uniref:hypothetical protein n=1 Tax=Aminobacter sp. UC22_36 TaxID=3374549 RepID=UPI00375812EA